MTAQRSLLIRLPEGLHRRLKNQAHRADISLNKHCVAILNGETEPDLQGKAPKPKQGADSGCLHLEELVSIVRGQLGSDVQAIAVFGSWSRGEQRASSDIDLLVVIDDAAVLDRSLYARWKEREFEGYPLSPLLVHLPKLEEEIRGVWLEVALSAIVIFDPTLGLHRYLSKVRAYIASGAVERKMSHGHPYWVRKERKAA